MQYKPLSELFMSVFHNGLSTKTFNLWRRKKIIKYIRSCCLLWTLYLYIYFFQVLIWSDGWVCVWVGEVKWRGGGMGRWEKYSFEQLAHKIKSTSFQRWFNVMTMTRRCFSVMCLLGVYLIKDFIDHLPDIFALYNGWCTVWENGPYVELGQRSPGQLITKSCLYNFDPLKPHFYVVKLGFTGVYIIFLISAQRHRLGVLVRTASLRRF